ASARSMLKIRGAMGSASWTRRHFLPAARFSLMLYYSEGNVIDMRETLRKFPVQLTSVKDYAHETMHRAAHS
ncbi:MAG TPA: hypothetical protein VES69_01225, partial [Pyrinomonadaceae bacterium]|nr:hypothetical protein [Pyrinomonadaceae bacterium]